MSVAFVAAASFATTFASNITQALNVGSAAGRCVLVLATNASSNSTTPSTATYNSVSMTAGTLGTASTGQQWRLFWLFNVTATGSNNVVVTYSDGNGKPQILASCYSGVDTTSGVSGETLAHALSAAPSWSITSATGDLGVALSIVDPGTGSTFTPTGPATADFTDHASSQIYDSFAWESAGASSLTIAGTTGTPTPNWWGSAVSLKALGGAAVSDVPRRAFPFSILHH